MAVASSGAISLNDFHTEAGGSANSTCTLNDSDIRGLIGKSAGASMNFEEWYGASGTVSVTTMTTGTTTNKSGTSTGFLTGNIGSLSDTTFDVDNKPILKLVHLTDGNKVNFTLDNQTSNTGFTTMTVGSTAYQRTDATFSTNNAGQAIWEWGSGNPFSGEIVITWT
tara:strand:+ start:1888 stop:2388 length:501 start_codon:yes stop_codon:yes gene_type:complete